MVREIVRKGVHKLFDDKERLLEERPELGLSYNQFLRDWEKYSKAREAPKKTEKSHNYLVFGALFKE